MADQGSEGLLSPFLRRKRILAVKPYLRGRVLDVGSDFSNRMIEPARANAMKEGFSPEIFKTLSIYDLASGQVGIGLQRPAPPKSAAEW
jgi:hypothetical protein